MNKAIIILALLLFGCTDERASRNALENQGFTKIQFHGYAMFACSEHDYFNTEFSAINAKGRRVSGVVCCGVLKSCTVRW